MESCGGIGVKTMLVPPIAARTDDAFRRKPIFDRKSVTRAPSQPVDTPFTRKHRSKKIPAKTKPSPETERLRREKQTNLISCCLCRSEMKASTLEHHLLKPCPLWMFSRKGRAAKKGLSKQKVKDLLYKAERLGAKAAPKTHCTKCGKLLSALAMDIHVGTCGKERVAHSDDGFPFVLLPQGFTGNVKAAMKRHFVTEQARHKRRSSDDWDWSRLDELELLRPKMTHFGRKGWFGYCVFEFTNTQMVVLETPLRANATYVVGANWKDLISLTKPEIRQGDHQRIFHLGDYWRRRVERALWK
jgi:hypothetical protein